MPEKKHLHEYLGNESLEVFTRQMQSFNQKFIDAMAGQVDFTLKLEVHGNKGCLIHARVQDDAFDRPSGAEKEKNTMANQKSNRW